MLKKLSNITILLCILSSCASKKNIIYLQDDLIDSEFSYEYEEYKINIDDVLKIDIASDVPEVLSFISNSSKFTNSPNKESLLFEGFQVDYNGFIQLNQLGEIYVKGLSINDLKEKITSLIIDGGYLLNPKVDIKILNLHYTILGEINRPGRYEYFSNNFNILQAIGQAGDLTINGVRKDVKLIRKDFTDNHKIISIDLTSSNLFENEYFQIISGDIIIINPNTSRVKNAGVIGNSGTLLSLLSFLLSSIIIISN